MAISKNIKQMTNEQRELFIRLKIDREENARVLEKTSMKGVKKGVTEKYSEQAHFIYELLQNADDVKATKVSFILENDQLLFAHNGTIHFSISDPANEKEDMENGKLGHINSITSIGGTNKFESEIGKFGFGFKSVFLYTDTPRIYDPPFIFKIERFIVPKLLENDHQARVGDETLFCFPFDLEMEADMVYYEIDEKLQNLDNPLLFLRHLEKIEWKNKDGANGIYSKHVDSYDGRSSFISLTKKVNEEQYVHKYLIFEKKIDNSHPHESIINVGFKLDTGKNKIISDGITNAYCFFSTREQTGLKFIVQAPFLLNDSREGIKQGMKWNKELIDQIAELTANILPEIRDNGLLDVDFLNVLPIYENKYKLPVPFMFGPVYDAVLNKLKSDEKLLPANGGGYICAKEALLGDGKPLIDLLNSEQLSFLFWKSYLFSWDNVPGNDNGRLIDFISQKFGIDWVKRAKIEKIDYGRTIRVYFENNNLFLRLNDDKSHVNLNINDGKTDKFPVKLENSKLNIYDKINVHWLDSSITNNPPGLWNYLKTNLGIEEITQDKFISKFTKEFIDNQKDDGWVINFYNFLADKPYLWRETPYPQGPLRNKPFIRLEKNVHVVPFEGKKPQAYLPSNSSYSEKTVKKIIADNEGARNFLRNLGLSKPNETTEILEDILPKYQKKDLKLSIEENMEHFKKILHAIETDFGIERGRLIEELKNTPFLLAFNNVTNEVIYRKPSEIYLSEAYTGDSDLETYFKGYDKAYFLSLEYKNFYSQEKLSKLFLELKIEDNKPKIIKFDLQFSWEEKRLLRRGESFTRDIECIDYNIDGLEHFLKNNLTSKNAVILWRILLKYISSLQTWQLNSFFQGQYHWFYYSNRYASFDSKFLKILRDNAWLPDKHGDFDEPSNLFLSQLNDEFNIKNDILNDKQNPTIKMLEEKLGFKKEEQVPVDLLKILPEEKRKLYELVISSSNEDIQATMKFIEDMKKKPQFPEQPAPDKDYRQQRAKEKYISSKNKEFKNRNRSIRISQNKIDQKTSLREWYSVDEKVICQICNKPSSFINKQGMYYFEAVEMVPDEKEYDDNALGLCPLCAAKYLYGERTIDEEIRQKFIKLYSDFRNGSISRDELKIYINLCGETANIRFVEKHFIDISPIFIIDENIK